MSQDQPQPRAVGLAALVLLATVVATVSLAGPVAAAETVTLDENTALTSSQQIERFEEQDVATAAPARLDLRLTVAESAETVGLSEFSHASSLNTYARIQYNESIERTIRFYVPTAYWTPRVKQGLQPAQVYEGRENVRLDLEPAEDKRYTAVTIHVTGPTDVVFGVGRATGGIFGFRSDVSGFVSNTTGIELPSLTSGGTEWEYVPQESLTGNNTTYEIHANDTDELTIQYDNDPEPGEEHAEWLPLPACDEGTADGVCRFQKEGAPNTVYLLSMDQSPPRIRYAENPGATSTGRSIVDELASVPGRVWEDVQSLWPGGS